MDKSGGSPWRASASGLPARFVRGVFLFDRKVSFLSNEKIRLCVLACGEIVVNVTALDAECALEHTLFYMVDKNVGRRHNRYGWDERKFGWRERRKKDGAACTYSG